MSEWKPKSGEIICYQWGRFSNDSILVIVVSVDPWECAEIWEAPEDSPKYVPDSPQRNIAPIAELKGHARRDAAAALIKHGFHAQAVEVVLPYVKELEYDLKQTLEGAQQSNRAQVQCINAGLEEINRLRKEVERLKTKAGEK